MTRKSTEKRQARERQQRMSERNPLGQRASYRGALHAIRGPEPVTVLPDPELEAMRERVSRAAVEWRAKWFATPVEDLVADALRPLTSFERRFGMSEAERAMLAIRGPKPFAESDEFDRLDVFERVRQIATSLGKDPAAARLLERQALSSGLPNRSAGRALAWASQESDDPHVRTFSDAAWANPRRPAWCAWVGLVLHLFEEHPRLEHAARMLVQNDPKDAEECFMQTTVPESSEARAALATWLLKHLKTAD